MIETINKETFHEVINKDVLTVVDMYADWCGPCKMMSPILDEVASEIADNSVGFFKINVDNEPEIAEAYSVMTIPTLLFFKNGQLLNTHVGLLNKNGVQAAIDAVK